VSKHIAASHGSPCDSKASCIKMVLIVVRGLNGQNNEGRSPFDNGSTVYEQRKMGDKHLIKEFLNNTTTSLQVA